MSNETCATLQAPIGTYGGSLPLLSRAVASIIRRDHLAARLPEDNYTMITQAHAWHSDVLRGGRRLFVMLAFAFALVLATPGISSASEGGFRHGFLMRGQVLEKQAGSLVVCVGRADGAQVGQVLDVIRHVRRARRSRGGGVRYRRESVGQVRIVELFEDHYAVAEVIAGRPKVNDTVELVRP